jgi:hypothetical protein
MPIPTCFPRSKRALGAYIHMVDHTCCREKRDFENHSNGHGETPAQMKVGAMGPVSTCTAMALELPCTSGCFIIAFMPILTKMYGVDGTNCLSNMMCMLYSRWLPLIWL